LCALTLWVGKRWVRPLTAPVSEGKYLRVLETLPLGGRCSVYLLQVGETRILAGVDHTGLKTLLPLPQSFDGALAELDDAKGADSAAPLVQYEAPEAA
jgi:flagellar biogenesis protein FliO